MGHPFRRWRNLMQLTWLKLSWKMCGLAPVLRRSLWQHCWSSHLAFLQTLCEFLQFVICALLRFCASSFLSSGVCFSSMFVAPPCYQFYWICCCFLILLHPHCFLFLPMSGEGRGYISLSLLWQAHQRPDQASQRESDSWTAAKVDWVWCNTQQTWEHKVSLSSASTFFPQVLELRWYWVMNLWLFCLAD